MDHSYYRHCECCERSAAAAAIHKTAMLHLTGSPQPLTWLRDDDLQQ